MGEITLHPLGFGVPGAYLQPPPGAPTAELAALFDDGYAVGPIGPLLTDYAPTDAETPQLQDALMVMAGTVRRRPRRRARDAAPALFRVPAKSKASVISDSENPNFVLS